MFIILIKNPQINVPSKNKNVLLKINMHTRINRSTVR